MQIGTADYADLQDKWEQQARKDRRRTQHFRQERRVLRDMLQSGLKLSRSAPGVAL